jgi:hypothetical protein
MSPKTAVAMEDILQYELFQQGAVQEAEKAATAAVAALLGAATEGYSEQDNIFQQQQEEVDEQRNILHVLEADKAHELDTAPLRGDYSAQHLSLSTSQGGLHEHQGGDLQGEYHHQQVPVVYTPFRGKRPYKNTPTVYVNVLAFREHVANERKQSLQLYNKAHNQ